MEKHSQAISTTYPQPVIKTMYNSLKDSLKNFSACPGSEVSTVDSFFLDAMVNVAENVTNTGVISESLITSMSCFFLLLSLSLSYRTCRPLGLDPCRLQCPRLPLGVVAQLLIIWSCFSARSALSNSSSINCWRRSLALASRAAVSCRNWSIWATSLSVEEMNEKEKESL